MLKGDAPTQLTFSKIPLGVNILDLFQPFLRNFAQKRGKKTTGRTICPLLSKPSAVILIAITMQPVE
ncbi:MAG: hypothetical protein ACE5F8_06785, partial [Woeseiaceae bacterium]